MRDEPQVELSEAMKRVLREVTPVKPSDAVRAQLWQRVDASAAAGTGLAAEGSLAAKAGLVAAGLLVGLGAGVGLGKVLFGQPPREVVRVVEIVVERDAGLPVVEEDAGVAMVSAPKPRVVPVVKTNADERAERQLLEVARTALLRRDAAAALDALGRHEARFATGVFAEERSSLEVQALVMAGRAEEAHAKGSEFLKKYPSSVFGPAVEASLNAAQ